MESHISDIVLSLRGRDKDALFLVVGEDAHSLLLASGRQRRAEKPKRKNRAHVTYQGTCDEATRKKLLETGRLTNSDIRNALDLWTGQRLSLDKGGKTYGKR